ncbi:MAG: cache domain-containing protein [Candidatus Aminicenantes bacterium]|nr:cache domain-containing protein [Candidatus Aminicenantes bacterium]
MSRKKNLARLFSYSSIIVISALTFIISIVLVFNKYRSFSEEAGKIEEKFYREQMAVIKSKVNEIVEYIDYNKSLTENILEKDIKGRVYEAYQIAGNLYESNKKSKSQVEIKKIIKDALRPIRFNKGRGYYFIDDLKNRIILYPPGSNLEGKTAPGENSIKNFIDLVKSEREGFTHYNWYKPHQGEIKNKKITYIKLFEPYDWIIGTGEYLDEVEQDIQEKVIERIKNTRFGQDKKYYIFVNAIVNKEGGAKFARAIVNPEKPRLVGKFIPSTYADDKGNRFFKKMVDECFAKGEAVATCRQETSAGKMVEKIYYSRLHKGWNWIVSSGFYPGDMEKIIARQKKSLKNSVINESLLIIAIFAVILVFAVLLAGYFSKKLKKEFDIFTNFFKDSAKKNEFLDKDNFKIAEFRALAESANKMIGHKRGGETALLKAKEIAEAAARLKTEFLLNVSHEIRTPMNAIIGMGELLAQTELNDEQLEYLDIMNNSSISLLAIINDVLDFSKMETGKIILEKKSFDVRSIVEGAAELVALEAYEKKLELVTNIDPGIPGELVGDPARLHQVLLNMLNNAVKFTDRGEIYISVETEKEKDEDIKLLFKIKDTGMGIAPKGTKRLFETSSQIGATLTRKHEGTGLGLALSRRLTELMNGRIGVESRYGKGSTFWFSALFKKVKSYLEPGIDQLPDLKGLRVLIVDDNETVRVTLCNYLESRGINCIGARDALESFLKLQSAAKEGITMDIALIDLNMPEISGLQIAKMIRDSAEIKKTKLVLLAPAAEYKSKKELTAIGFDTFLAKPVKQAQLYDCIAEVMGFSQPVIAQEKFAVSKNVFKNIKKMMDKPLEILVVEDNYFNQKVVELNLKKFGHGIEIAENGKIAVRKFNEKPYDLILMDVQMPVMDGYGATRTIRSIEEELRKKSGQEAHIPIIAMTANVGEGDELKSLQAGMDAHLTKPFSVEKLFRTINKIVVDFHP